MTTRIIDPPKQSLKFLNANLGYEVMGKGKPVILLHGAMTANPWGGFEKRLATKYLVHMPHLPGFGSSECVEGRLHNVDLFADALSAFVTGLKLHNAPIVAFSLGTVVAAKAACGGTAKGRLLFVGAPGKVESRLLKLAMHIPIRFRRFIVSTQWGKEKILIPLLHNAIGVKENSRNDTFLQLLQHTDVRSLVDMDVYKEIEIQMPNLIHSLRNKVTFIYGEMDGVRNASNAFVMDESIIKGADHNVFSSQPKQLISLLERHLG